MTDERRRSLRATPPRRRLSVVTVLGELLITFGVVVLMFIGWQVWLNNVISGVQQHTVADGLSQEWANDPVPTNTPTATPTTDPGAPVVMAAPVAGKAFANLIVPRLGTDFKRPISEGVGRDVLDNSKKGLGHYVQTQLPGQVGNFALASHRTAYGGAFHDINQLVVGDGIYIETPDGWYKYIFRDLQFVHASAVAVIQPVPQVDGVKATQRLITLTTCNPLLSSAERMIAYGVFDSWYPRADGPPAEIATLASASGVN